MTTVVIFHLYVFRGFGYVGDEHGLYLVRWSCAIWTVLRDLTLGFQCGKLLSVPHRVSREKAAIRVIEEKALGSDDRYRLDEDGSLEGKVTQHGIMAVSSRFFRLSPVETLSKPP